ncbi:hypothetical protein VTN00DRAFT_6076 [Thermoascus crustaceus]|uniref:uncharacterized protein n=1 Tax=Thermoascus crustaceus TaxID=5088 RepID=UPI003741F8F8
MLFDKDQRNGDTSFPTVTLPTLNQAPREDSTRPLACMIFFFASQMTRNLETKMVAVPESEKDGHQSSISVHRLDTLLSEVQQHAKASPYVTRFESIPVEMPPPGRPKGTTREEMHDILLLASFKNKWAWEQWIQTKEWQRFMQQTEKEGVFRRIPHVRCASSLKGLRDPIDVLTS